MRFEKKPGHTNLKPERVYLHIIDLFHNDSKHLLRSETSKKSIFKTFCYNNKNSRKIKHFQVLSNKEI